MDSLNEGLGGCYERIILSHIIKRLAQERGAKSILEADATFIAGIPGFNSCILAQAGYDVTVLVRERDYEDTKAVWNMLNLKATIVPYSYPFPFKDNQFDFVWNHLVFEHYQHPSPLIPEMKRVSRNTIMTTTLGPYSPGFILHYLIHKAQKKYWDHGYPNMCTIEAMKQEFRYVGLEVVETGALDVPPWQDTVDGQIGDSMTYIAPMPKAARDRWVWVSADPRCQEHKIVKLFWEWEQTLPRWFKILVAHHLYVVGVKR